MEGLNKSVASDSVSDKEKHKKPLFSLVETLKTKLDGDKKQEKATVHSTRNGQDMNNANGEVIAMNARNAVNSNSVNTAQDSEEDSKSCSHSVSDAHKDSGISDCHNESEVSEENDDEHEDDIKTNFQSVSDVQKKEERISVNGCHNESEVSDEDDDDKNEEDSEITEARRSVNDCDNESEISDEEDDENRVEDIDDDGEESDDENEEVEDHEDVQNDEEDDAEEVESDVQNEHEDGVVEEDDDEENEAQSDSESSVDGIQIVCGSVEVHCESEQRVPNNQHSCDNKENNSQSSVAKTAKDTTDSITRDNDTKNSKDAKTAKDSTDTTNTRDIKDTKNTKTAKDTKDSTNTRDIKDTKNTKTAKDTTKDNNKDSKNKKDVVLNNANGKVHASPSKNKLLDLARNELSSETDHASRPSASDRPTASGLNASDRQNGNKLNSRYLNILGVTSDDSDVITYDTVDSSANNNNVNRTNNNGHVNVSVHEHSSNDNNNSDKTPNMNNFSKLLGLVAYTPKNGRKKSVSETQKQEAQQALEDEVTENAKQNQTGKIKSKTRFTLPFSKRSKQEVENNNNQNGASPGDVSPNPNSVKQNGGAKHFSFKAISGLSQKLDPRKLRGNGDVEAGEATGRQFKQTTENGLRKDAANEGQSCGCCGTGPRSCVERVQRLPTVIKVRRWMEKNVIEGHEIRNTVVVGIAFQLIFTAHFAIQNLQSSLHEEEYLGVSALGCLYATSIFSSIFAPTILGLLGTKGCLITAWLCHILYTVAQYYPSWETLVPASIVLGSMIGPTWTAQGLYVSACAYSFSKRSKDSPYTIVSRFQGIFFTLFETRQILGNILSSSVLRDGIANSTEEETVFRFCGPKDCPYYENVTDIEEVHPEVWSGMLTVYLCLQVVALILTVFLVAPLSRNEWSARAPICDTAFSWFRTLIGSKMIFLVPFMIFQAMEQGILLSEYTKSYVSCPIGIHMVGFVMATHGATAAAFIFLFSRLARLTGRFPLFALAAVISVISLSILYGWTPSHNEEALIFLFPVLWGVSEGIWQAQTSAMIAVQFWDRKEPAFANYQTCRAVGFTIIFGFHSLLCVSTKIAICLGFLVVGMILYTGVELHIKWKERVRISKPGGEDISSSNREGWENGQEPSDNQGVPGDTPFRCDDIEGSWSVPTPDNLSSSSGHSSFRSTTSTKWRKLVKTVMKNKRTAQSNTTTATATTVDIEQQQKAADDETHSAKSWSSSSSSASFPRTLSVVLMTEGDGEVGLGTSVVTLDGAILEKGESAYLDNDLRRYGVAAPAGRRPITSATSTTALSHSSTNPNLVSTRPHTSTSSRHHSSTSAPTSNRPQSDVYGRWGEEESVWADEGDLISPRVRAHSWHEEHFQDEGELRVVWTKDDVYVY